MEEIQKIEEIYIATKVISRDISDLKDQVTRQNSRVGKLEDSDKSGMAAHAVYEERMANFCIVQKEHTGKLDKLNQRVLIGAGAIIGASYLPQLLIKFIQ